MGFNHLNVPESWQAYFTKYPNGLSILEAIIQWVSQVDAMVDHLNLTDEQIEKLFTDTLPENVETILDEWYVSGKLADLINLGILGGIEAQLNEHTKQLTGTYNIKSFNVVGDGVTDDTLAIQNAINNVPEGATLFFPNGTYLITSRLTVTRNINLCGNRGKSILTGDCDLLAVYSDDSILTTTTSGITASASSAIVLNDVTGLQPEQIIRIKDPSLLFPYDSRGSEYYGEMNIIKSVDVPTKTVTLYFQTQYTYANATEILAYNPLENIELSGLSFIRKTKVNNLNYGFGFQWTRNALIQDVLISGFGYVGCTDNQCVGTMFKNMLIDDCFYVGVGLGYGIQTVNSLLTKIVDSNFKNCRRAVDFSGDIPSRFCEVINCEATTSTTSAYDCEGFGTHGTADMCRFINCTVYGSKNAFNARGLNISFENCKSFGTGNFFGVCGSGYGHSFIGCKSDKKVIADYDTAGFIFVSSPNYTRGNKSLIVKNCEIKISSYAIYIDANVPTCDLYLENCNIASRSQNYITTADFLSAIEINVHSLNTRVSDLSGLPIKYNVVKGTNVILNVFDSKSLSTMYRKEMSGVTPPASVINGTINKGDLFWNDNPVAGGYLGWVCITGGAFPTWKGFGLIEA